MGLCPAGNAWCHRRAEFIVRNYLRETFGLRENVASRADKRKVAEDNVPTLRHFVERACTKILTNTSDNVCGIFFEEEPRGAFTLGHGAELPDAEAATIFADAVLGDKHGAFGIEFDSKCNERKE